MWDHYRSKQGFDGCQSNCFYDFMKLMENPSFQGHVAMECQGNDFSDFDRVESPTEFKMDF